MGFEDLGDFERRLYEYIRDGDFETVKWDSNKAATHFEVDVDLIYKSLSNLSKHIRDSIYIHYKDGGLRISAE